MAIETDCRSTKDGVVLVAHDDDLKRLTGRELKVSETDHADIPKYTSTFMCEFGHHDYRVKKSDDARFCTLEELFQAVPSTQIIQIDIKDAANKATCLKVRQLVD